MLKVIILIQFTYITEYIVHMPDVVNEYPS